jgi:DNA-binding transcriptional regulator YdaS (Cro superfamily)
MTPSTPQPKWLRVLHEACSVHGQRRIAERLRVSQSALNQVLNGKYKAKLDKIEARVRGELMQETVLCPALAEISKRRCQDEQRRPFAATNPQRVAVYRACRSGCPLSMHTNPNAGAS